MDDLGGSGDLVRRGRGAGEGRFELRERGVEEGLDARGDGVERLGMAAVVGGDKRDIGRALTVEGAAVDVEQTGNLDGGEAGEHQVNGLDLPGG